MQQLTLILLTSYISASGNEKARTNSEFLRYCNGRFNFCIDIPSGMKWQRPPDNGDGQHWKGPGNSDVTVWGSWNVEESPTPKFYCPDVKEFDSISLHKTTKTWCVTSGWKNGDIIYHREAVSHDTTIAIQIKYPPSQRSFFDAKIGHMIRSIKFNIY